MVSLKFSHWAIRDAVIDQAKAVKFLIRVMEHVLLKMETEQKDTIFGATRMFDPICEEAISLFI